MKKYFIDDYTTYCYPYETRKSTKDYGVLSKYIGKYFNRDEADKIICELIMRHPYIENSMEVEIKIMWKEKNMTGFYHILDIRNDNFEKQTKGSLEIKYEK